MTTDRRTFLKAAAASAALAAPEAVFAQAGGKRPAGGGLSRARLARMRNAMLRHVESGRMPGLVTLVSRRGETHVDAIGVKAFGGREPMRRDTIMIQRVWDSPVAPAVNRDFWTAAYQAIDD